MPAVSAAQIQHPTTSQGRKLGRELYHYSRRLLEPPPICSVDLLPRIVLRSHFVLPYHRLCRQYNTGPAHRPSQIEPDTHLPYNPSGRHTTMPGGDNHA